MEGGKSRTEPNRADPSRFSASVFFVFLEEFRKQFHKDHPDVDKAGSAKAGSSKWKTMSDAEKAPYAAEAARRKAAYYENLVTEKLNTLNPFPTEESD